MRQEIDRLTAIYKTEPQRTAYAAYSEYTERKNFQEKALDQANNWLDSAHEERETAAQWGIRGLVALWLSAVAGWWIFRGLKATPKHKPHPRDDDSITETTGE